MGFWDSLKSFAGNLWSGVKNTASNVWNKVSPYIRMVPGGSRVAGAVENIAGAINSGVDAVGDLSRGNYARAGENIRDAYNRGKEGVERLTMKAGGVVRKMFQKTK
jgi:phage-related protein